VILYRATFSEKSIKEYLSYATYKWVFVSLAMIFAYGLGILMLLYTPVMRHIFEQDIRNRRLYITSESIVYKTSVPCCFPCCGRNKQEKHVLLPLVTDVLLTQGCFEAKFNIQTIKVENAGQSGGEQSLKFDLQCQGLDDPQLFKRIALMAATAKRNGRHVTSDVIAEAVRGVISTPSGPGQFPAQLDPFSRAPVAAVPMQFAANSAVLESKLDMVVQGLNVVAQLLKDNNDNMAKMFAAKNEKLLDV